MAQYDFVTNEYQPRSGNRLTRWLGAGVLNLMGWKITGSFPEEPKVVFIGMPHTSNWDLILALAAMQAAGLRCSWMMKKEAFFWPLGGLFKKMGGVPIDRKARNDVTVQMADWFNANEKAYLGLTPEGTRSKVETLKKGYLRIAYAAKVPVFLIAVDGKNKAISLDRVWPLTGDIERDNADIKAYYDQTYVGIRPEKS
ncbi:1-acyl-sn-glycerol-3-phosphate acyltransferase [Hellea balneolensis]|uniref:1-acyl-sn-glycerol-3-phosphate acyltransferase n=1 Tax=Hellea balneolensis TaxID=287478 RepID=UPI000402CFC9|nr:1-acyl-sn-glycerol-3-phosphate acyltransferase [Hellea balneolensis]